MRPPEHVATFTLGRIVFGLGVTACSIVQPPWPGRRRPSVAQRGWCPVQLPDNHDDWYLHFLVEHGRTGFSVRMYEAKTIEEEAAEL